MRLTSRCQVTIPLEVRKKLELISGAEIDFVVDGDGARIVKADRKSGKMTRGEKIVARAAGSATANLDLTTDQILAWTKGWDDENHPDR